MSVTIELSDDEALVIFDWLVTLNKDEPARPEAEHVVLWSMEAQLERVLAEPFREDYPALLNAARARVVGPYLEET